MVKEFKDIGVEEASMIHTERMLKKNLTWDLIAEITGITQEQYSQWQKSKESAMSAA